MEQLQHLAREQFGVELDEHQIGQFARLADELVQWNATRANLTAITERDAILRRHFLDSLSLMPVVELKPGMRLADVGSGPGFPGLPLAIACPGLEVTMIEATRKKVQFVDHIIELLGLTGCMAIHDRAEEAGHMDTERAQYDVVVARAVARLPVLVEYLLPLARVGGVCIAMKGETAAQEAADAARGIRKLGGRLREITQIDLPGVEHPHFLVVIDKTRPTPAAYPRSAGLPVREPLT
jgi:16S rRNA (guanine527-N7)-methyltransferase